MFSSAMTISKASSRRILGDIQRQFFPRLLISETKEIPNQLQCRNRTLQGNFACRTAYSATRVTQVEENTASLSSADNNSNCLPNKPEPPPIVWMTHRLNQQQIAKVDAIFHKILWLDMFETSMLVELVNERLGRVKLTPNQRKMIEKQMDARVSSKGGESDTTKTPADEKVEVKPKLVDVKLVGYDEKAKIKVIKEIRSIVDGLGLKEAKELVEGFPKTTHKGIKPELAEEYKAKLEAVGAKIELVFL